MDAPPFRFYDNRQNYLAFVNTCNGEIGRRATAPRKELVTLRSDAAGAADLRCGHGRWHGVVALAARACTALPAVPCSSVAKEISLEDVRLGLEKMPDRFHEHPASVFVVTNLNYADAPPGCRGCAPAAALNWQEVRLTGTSTA